MNQTLHDWLLARHRDATPQLDAIRRSALPPQSPDWRDLLHGLFHPHRAVWGSLALVWLILVVLHVAFMPRPQPTRSHPPPEIWSDDQFATAIPNEILPKLDGHS